MPVTYYKPHSNSNGGICVLCYAMGPDTGVEPVLNEYESFVLPIYESGKYASYVD